MTPQTKSRLFTIAVNACRLLLAVTFIFSGLVKANDPLGMAYKLEEYVNAITWLTLPDTFLLGSAVLLALFEFMLGMNLLIGMNKRATVVTAAIFMSTMTLLTVYIAITDPVSDCGCFGEVLVLSNTATLIKNIVLLVAAIVICRYPCRLKQFLPPSIEWLIAFVSLCFIVCYAVYSIIFLPVFDFSPYKKGTDLQSAVLNMQAQRTFDVKFIYEKNGQTLELTAEDDDPDSTWTYVETQRTPLTETASNIVDFYVENEEGEDMTEDILLADGYTFLLVIPRLTNADEGCTDKVNEIYYYAQDHGMGFYCLTASADEQAQTYWSEHTGAEYGYCTAEESMLKSFVRGNPGLVLLQDGVIIQKWSNYNMPNEEDLKKEYGT